MLDVEKMKRLLRKSGVAIRSGTTRDQLSWRLFVAIRLGLPVIDTEEKEDQRVMESKAEKLKIEILDCVFNLPHPMTLLESDWERDSVHFPNLLDADVECFFQTCETLLLYIFLLMCKPKS